MQIVLRRIWNHRLGCNFYCVRVYVSNIKIVTFHRRENKIDDQGRWHITFTQHYFTGTLMPDSEARKSRFARFLKFNGKGAVQCVAGTEKRDLLVDWCLLNTSDVKTAYNGFYFDKIPRYQNINPRISFFKW